MPQPRLIHPIEVTIALFNRDAMLMDNDAREPIHGARSQSGDTVKLLCQVHFDRLDDPQANVGGTNPDSAGYFLARSIDMNRVLGPGQRLKRGDHIVQYTSLMQTEQVVCNLFISRGDPMGHYPGLGATLWKYTVVDRGPVQ